MNANKTMDDCKRGFVGVSANFAVTAVLSPNTAGFRFQPLHPTPLALMPLPATFTEDRRAANHVDDHGDHEADELEERKCGGEQLKVEPRGAKRNEVEMARAEASGGRKGDSGLGDGSGWSGSGWSGTDLG